MSTFACCSDWKKCSEAGECIKEDEEYKKKCYLAYNLKKGFNPFKKDQQKNELQQKKEGELTLLDFME